MKGRYKAYPEYKSVDSPWFNNLPTHWQSVSLKWVSRLYAGGTPSKDNLSFWENGSIPWLNSGAVNQSLIMKPSALITREAFNNSSAKWIPKESLVMALAGQGKTKGMVAQLGIESTCNQSMAAIVPSGIYPSRFLFWWLTSNYQNIRNMAGGDLRDGLNLELLGSISCPIFNNDEQQKIANFLDHKTAKIDTLITKQEKLIKLLKEKRQAVISHAVTKGLNPDAPMKDSGVEWLGEVPEHWDVMRLKHLIKSLESGCSVNAADVPAKENELGVLKTSCVYTRRFRASENKTVVVEELSRVKCPVRKGAIIISRMNTPELVGASALVDTKVSNLFLPDRLWQTIFDERFEVNSEFLAHFMTVEGFRNQISLSAEGASSSMQNIAKEDYLAINVLLPQREEQTQIVSYIKESEAKFLRLETKAVNAIQLMKERKTALISAAVTGKIDVRDWSAN